MPGQDTLLLLEPDGLPEKTEDKRRAKGGAGNATRQLGAN